MKTRNLKIITLILLLTSGFCSSQDLQPKKTQLNNEDGLFISFPLMDSISLKLIDRKFVKKENQTFQELFQNESRKFEELSIKFDLSQSQAFKYKTLWEVSESQKELALESLDEQKIITVNIQKRARKNGLLYLGGGFALGVTFFAILAN